MGQLRKTELVARIAARARARYGADFGEALFNDLTKDRLLPPATRSANVGKSAVYLHDHRTYRRALQIARLRSAGFRNRDALRVQLFLKGYSLPALDVRAPLWNEYRNVGRALLAQVRSTYADNKRAIPGQHKKGLVSEMGQLDERFDDAGLRRPDDFYVEVLRAAKQDPLVGGLPRNLFRSLRHDAPPNCDQFAATLPKLLSGMLMLEPAASDDNSDEADFPEKLIKNSTAEFLLAARAIYRMLVRDGFRLGLNLSGKAGSADAREPAIDALAKSAKLDPKFAAFVFVLCLRLASLKAIV